MSQLKKKKKRIIFR